MEENATVATFGIPSRYGETFTNFFEKYELVVCSLMPQFDNKLLPKQDRVCRFCGKKFGETKFKNDSHLIPGMLGNNILLSDFECDLCNNFFGKTYESDLANYLGLSRAISFTKNKGKLSKYKSVGKSITVTPEKINGEDFIVISRENSEDSSIISDPINGRIIVNYIKHPYTPANIYRTFLKIALSGFPDKVVERDYKGAIDYLIGEKKIQLSGAVIFGYRGPHNLTRHPYFSIYVKKNMAEAIHSHFFVINFQDYILCLPVPFNKNDLGFYNSPIELIAYPPLVLQTPELESMAFTEFFEDIGNEKRLSGEPGQLSITFDGSEMENSATYDPNTGITERTPYNPSAIMKIAIMNSNTGIDLRSLTDILKRSENESY